MKAKNALILAVLFVAAVGLMALTYFGIGQNKKLSYHDIKKGLDLSGGVYIAYDAYSSEADNKEKKEYTPTGEEMETALAIIRRRLDDKGWTEAEVSKEGTRRIRVEIPGVDDAETAINELGQTAQLSFCDESLAVLVEGKNVENAAAGVDQNGNYVVSLKFNEEGKKQFAEATQKNIGKSIFILMDNTLLSAPTVNEAITNGNAQISGSFTSESAQNLASLIKSGSLPFALDVVSSNTVGATLGVNSLRTSAVGGVVGVGLVLIFMLIFYRMLGFVADWALAIYFGIEMFILSFFNITLTLPGVAGVILTVGMAVDANVIIFERIKEELRQGKTIKVAVNNGFSRAFPAIFDSNFTTIIAGIVLYWLGTGPIKGFAQTLIIGIVISMFTAIVITRLLLKAVIGIGIKNPKLYCGK